VARPRRMIVSVPPWQQAISMATGMTIWPWAYPTRTNRLFNIATAGVITGVQDLDPGLGLDFVPYLSLRGKREHLEDEDTFDLEPGFDLRYRITPGLTATLTVNTGYFRDRLLPTATLVYDKRSNSGAFLAQLTYRWTENFSATFGAALFAGRVEKKKAPLNPPASLNRTGRGANKSFAENGLSILRDRDELFLQVRYTF